MLGLAVALCGRAEAGSVSADLRVSAVVVDQCVVRAGSRSASCSGQASYALNVGQEAAPTRDQLTALDEHAHTASHGSLIASAQSTAGGPAGAARDVAILSSPVQVVRVTYSF
jgi:hypothetical protein